MFNCFRKAKSNSDIKPAQTIIQNTVDIDYDKLADAIIKAHKQMEKDKTEIESREHETFRKSIGYKEYNNPVRAWLNSVGCMLNVCFISKKDVTTTEATYGLIQEFTTGIINLLKLALYLIALGFLWTAALLLYQRDITNAVAIIFGAFTSFLFARLFRFVSIEIGKIRNKQEVLDVSSTVTALVALVIALVALFLEVSGK